MNPDHWLSSWSRIGCVLAATASCSESHEQRASDVGRVGGRLGEGASSSGGTAVVTAEQTLVEAGHLSSPRYRHTATLLPDGRVVIAGGATEALEPLGLGRAPEASITLLDPRTLAFTEVAEMSAARWGHTATLLRDSRVLLVGGYDQQGKALRSADLFTPDAGAPSEVALEHARGLHSATLLPDGNVLIVGGSTDPASGGVVASAEVFDVAEEKFEDLGPVPDAAFPHASALLADGRVASVWSHGYEMRFSLFEPGARSFEAPFPPVACDFGKPVEAVQECFDVFLVRSPLTQTLDLHLADGSWSVSTADGMAETVLDDGFIFDTKLGAVPSVARSGSSIVAFGIQRDFIPPNYAGTVVYTGRLWSTATALPNGEVLVVGGKAGSVEGSSELYSAPWQTQPLSDLVPATSDGHATTLLADGQLLVTGGHAAGKQASLWDPSTSGPALQAGQLLADRSRHQALLLRSGSVLIAGGDTRPVDAPEELYDAQTRTSRALDLRLRARGSAVRINDRELLFAGSSGLEKLDVESWEVRAIPLALECPAPALVRMANGHVLVSGDQSLRDFDPTTETITPLEPYRSPTCDTSLAALPDGFVLMAGGRDPSGEVSTLAQRFNPITGESIVLSELPEPLVGAKAVPRLDGILLFGSAPDGLIPKSDIFFDGRFDSFRALPHTYAYALPDPSVTLLPDSGLLVAGSTFAHELSGPVGTQGGVAEQPLLEVKQGDEVELLGTGFSTTWPEDSGGTTAASPTNYPVPVWFPAVGGWPVLGAFVEWSEDRATWRVPRTPFPGLGVLTYARSGVTYPLRMVRILEQENGERCEDNGACASGHCVAGPPVVTVKGQYLPKICCDRACDGACESCWAKVKGTGRDGICGGSLAGSEDDRCGTDEVRSCGNNGLCDGAGACALYPEGTECKSGSSCRAGACERDEPVPILCDGDHRVMQGENLVEDCGAYRCLVGTDECSPDCETNRECSEGFACSSTGACEAARPVRAVSVGCAPECTLTAGRSGRDLEALALSVLLLAIRRARASVRQSRKALR